MTFPWLTVLGLLPIVGSLLPFLLKGQAAKYAGMVVALATLALSIFVATQTALTGGFSLVEDHPWIGAFGVHYALGLDGLGLVMVLLTTVLVPIVLLAEWNISERSGKWSAGAFFGLVLMLEGLSIFVFTSIDVLLFYLFFEATLLPMYFLIGAWGGPRRGAAAIKFLLFSLAGGLIMLGSIIGLYAVSARNGNPTYLLTELMKQDLGGNIGRWLMLGFLIAFIIKAPLAPLHTWLPDTAEQATPGSSTLLVSILDKIGAFGMLRFCIGLFPEASHWITPFMLILAIVSIVYGALVACGQKNMLRLVAYSSVSHFGFIVLGIYAMTMTSLQGSMFYMLNHGFSTAAMFLVIGFLIRRRGSANVKDFGGVQKVAPILAGLLLMSILASISLPGMSNFVSEIMVIIGTWSRYPIHTAFAILGVVLGAVYALTLYQRSMTGPVTAQTADAFGGEAVSSGAHAVGHGSEHVLTTEAHVAGTHAASNGHGATAVAAPAHAEPVAAVAPRRDATIRERLVMIPLLGLILLLGFFPKPVLHWLEPTASSVMQHSSVTDPAPQAGKGEK